MTGERGTLTRRAVLAGAAAALPMAAMPGASAATPACGSGSGGFAIKGAELLWRGAPVRLTGVAVGDPVYIRKDRPLSDYAVLAADWRANVVRISLHPGHFRADRAGAMKSLGFEIEAARAAGLFVIVDWHAIGFPGRYMEPVDPRWGLPADAYDPDFGLATAFWTEMASSFGRDPGVVFELWNEPVVDPKLWVSTGQHWPLLKANWSKLVATIRRRSEALLLVSGGRWAHDLVGVAKDPIDDPRLAYAWHCYPGEVRKAGSDWAASLDGLAAVKPVVVTEWGFCENCGHDLGGTAEDFGRPFARDVLDRLGLHSTAWCWSPGAAPAMLEADWRTPDAYGRFVQNYLAETASARPSCARRADRTGGGG